MAEYLIISDIPTPWREPVFERVYRKLGEKVDIVYFKNNEKRRLWTFNKGGHPKKILKAITLITNGTERFFNPGIIPFLIQKRPRFALIMTCMKDPSGWLAMGLCKLLGVKIALLEDSWMGREKDINIFQTFGRKVVYNYFGKAFVGASKKTLKMFKYYNRKISEEQCFLSHLVADNEYFEKRLANLNLDRSFDVMFSGRIVEIKNPIFFAKVCAGIKKQLGRCRVLIIGEGDEILKAKMKMVFEKDKVSYDFAGFIPHADLPYYYAKSRLLLLPTSGDCWGVVINEAMIAGTPVITTNWTAAAGELVLHGQNGFILPLNEEIWSSAAFELLTFSSKWESFSDCARKTVKTFNYDNAATGILNAFDFLKKL